MYNAVATTPAQRLGVLLRSFTPAVSAFPRKPHRVGLRIVLFEACSAFTRVTACTLALSPIRDTLTEGFSHFVSSMTAPVASGWSGRRVGLAPTGKRRLSTAHTPNRHDDRELTIKPFHPVPERMRSPMILAFVRKTMSQKIVVTP